jgi:hypothetical protein
MDQGLDAVDAAAAIAVLAMRHPITAYAQSIAHTTDTTATFSVLLSTIAATTSQIQPTPPRPDQGGERITLNWLHALSEENCLWRFRLVVSNSE